MAELSRRNSKINAYQFALIKRKKKLERIAKKKLKKREKKTLSVLQLRNIIEKAFFLDKKINESNIMTLFSDNGVMHILELMMMPRKYPIGKIVKLTIFVKKIKIFKFFKFFSFLNFLKT